MELNEVARFWNCSREQLKEIITKGTPLPVSGNTIKLDAEEVNGDYFIKEEDLDAFIKKFDEEEPGRHPPTAIRRELLVESNHKCGICKNNAPFNYHHILKFSKVKHHDPSKMLVVCGTCHDLIGNGTIDSKSQKMYKDKLVKRSKIMESEYSVIRDFPFDEPVRFTWDDLNVLISELNDYMATDKSTDESKYDFDEIDIEKKNELNKLGQDYFDLIKDYHEPCFGIVRSFLMNPINKHIASKYHQIVDELRSKIAANRVGFEGFEHFLLTFCDTASSQGPETLRSRSNTLNILLSFMYFNCDIGKKND